MRHPPPENAAIPTTLPVSPLLLADQMLTLAQQAGHAGLADTAARLIVLAHDVFDEDAAARRVPAAPMLRLVAQVRPVGGKLLEYAGADHAGSEARTAAAMP